MKYLSYIRCTNIYSEIKIRDDTRDRASHPLQFNLICLFTFKCTIKIFVV